MKRGLPLPPIMFSNAQVNTKIQKMHDSNTFYDMAASLLDALKTLRESTNEPHANIESNNPIVSHKDCIIEHSHNSGRS